MASVGGEKYINLYLDGSWDGRRESLAVWTQHCRRTWESMGSGKVLAPPRRGPWRGPNQLTTRKALWMEAGQTFFFLQTSSELLDIVSDYKIHEIDPENYILLIYILY